MLHLYKNISPNTDDKHYYFNTPTQYKTALASSLAKSITLDNYRINSNVIKIAIDTDITEAVADTITYAIDEREENGTITYFRCYHVNRINIQSGFVILYCSVDLWASYFYKASISNLVVTRCNRSIGTGLLDDIAGTKGELSRSYCAVSGHTSGDNNELWNNDDVYIVFALKFNVKQNSDGAIARIRLFAFNMRTIRQTYYNLADTAIGRHEDPDTHESISNDPMALYTASIQNPIELAKDLISGIYGIVGYNGFNFQTTLNAVVLGAWFINGIGAVGNSNTTIASYWHRQYANDIQLHPLEVLDAETTTTLNITNDFNKQFYVGTLRNGLKLERTTDATIQVVIKVITSTDKLTIIAYQGDTQTDITSAFAITIGTTDGDISAERALLSAFETSTKIIGSSFAMVKGVMSGSAFATATGILGLTNAVGDAVSKSRSNHIGAQISGGDGSIAFNRYYGGDYDNPQNNALIPLKNPYVINGYTSINDEKANVRLFGAKFSELTTFASVFNASLMGTGTLTDTYLQATCKVDNIPTDASDLIKSRLGGGVYLVKLT